MSDAVETFDEVYRAAMKEGFESREAVRIATETVRGELPPPLPGRCGTCGARLFLHWFPQMVWLAADGEPCTHNWIEETR